MCADIWIAHRERVCGQGGGGRREVGALLHGIAGFLTLPEHLSINVCAPPIFPIRHRYEGDHNCPGRSGAVRAGFMKGLEARGGAPASASSPGPSATPAKDSASRGPATAAPAAAPSSSSTPSRSVSALPACACVCAWVCAPHFGVPPLVAAMTEYVPSPTPTPTRPPPPPTLCSLDTCAGRCKLRQRNKRRWRGGVSPVSRSTRQRGGADQPRGGVSSLRGPWPNQGEA
jgi:hypothetical protein